MKIDAVLIAKMLSTTTPTMNKVCRIFFDQTNGKALFDGKIFRYNANEVVKYDDDIFFKLNANQYYEKDLLTFEIFTGGKGNIANSTTHFSLVLPTYRNATPQWYIPVENYKQTSEQMQQIIEKMENNQIASLTIYDISKFTNNDDTSNESLIQNRMHITSGIKHTKLCTVNYYLNMIKKNVVLKAEITTEKLAPELVKKGISKFTINHYHKLPKDIIDELMSDELGNGTTKS